MIFRIEDFEEDCLNSTEEYKKLLYDKFTPKIVVKETGNKIKVSKKKDKIYYSNFIKTYKKFLVFINGKRRIIINGIKYE